MLVEVSAAVLVGMGVAVWVGVAVSTAIGSIVDTGVAVSSLDTNVGIARDGVDSAPCEAGVSVTLSLPPPPPPRAYIPNNPTMSRLPATATAKGRTRNFLPLVGVSGVMGLALTVAGSAALSGRGVMAFVSGAATALCKATTSSPAL